MNGFILKKGETARDSIIYYMAGENTLKAKYGLALEYLGFGDTTQAASCLNAIPDNFNLNTMQLNEYQNYQDYFDLLIGMKADGRTVLQADSVEIATLFYLLNNSYGKIHALVRNTLISMDSLEFKEDYIFPSGLKTGRVRYKPNDSNYKEDKLKLYPNPAGGYVVVEYTLANEHGDSRLAFVDSKGMQVKTINLENKHDYLVVSIKDLPNGFYICTLLTKGNGVKTIKLTITN
ncbi:MAG: T9SS type A sorting domain-containing protein [Bacteroidota bacterium]|nr:T9SS type A sorting domain-containing protein [Bacteroidota bacterium]